jgi:predicted transcriptional regulator
MQENPTPTVADQERHSDREILELLLDHEEQRPWSVEELAREMGERIDTLDSLARLRAAGLIHRCGEFVFASRAALVAERLGQ